MAVSAYWRACGANERVMTVRPGLLDAAPTLQPLWRARGWTSNDGASRQKRVRCSRHTGAQPPPLAATISPPHPGVDEASKTLSAFLHIAPLCPFLSLRVVKQSLFDLHGCGPPPSSGTMTMTIYFLLVPIATVDPDPKIVLDPTNFLRPTTRVFVRFGGCPQSSWVQGRRLL